MSHDNNQEDLKIKNTFLVTVKSRKEDKKVKFTKWINAQNNPQSSILTMIEHLIDRFGYEDIMDHEIAKKLYTEKLYFSDAANESVEGSEKPVRTAFEDELEEESTRTAPPAAEPQKKHIPIDPNAY